MDTKIENGGSFLGTLESAVDGGNAECSRCTRLSRTWAYKLFGCPWLLCVGCLLQMLREERRRLKEVSNDE